MTETGKKRYSIKFQAVNYSDTGSGKGFSDYDLESNLQITPPVGYTVEILYFNKDDTTHSGEFKLESTPEIPDDEKLPITLSLKTKQIGDGGANDSIVFINNSVIINLGLIEVVSPPTTTPEEPYEETFVSSFLDSPGSSNAVRAGKILVISSSVSRGFFPLCSHFAFSMIRLFQIIEILSKFIYVPVVFSGKMESFLNSISGLTGPIEISSEIFIHGKVQDGYMNYKGKIFKAGEYANILQSMPISTTFYIFLEFFLLIISWTCQKKLNSRKSRVTKLKRLVSYFQIFFIETNIIDFWFYALLNITLFPRISEQNFQNTIAFVLAIYILLSSLYKYMNSYFEMKFFLEKISHSISYSVDNFILDIGFDGLKSC